MRQKATVENYQGLAGGWGSLNAAVAQILTQEEVALLGSEILLRQLSRVIPVEQP